jgi:hypothetical protein
MTPSSVASTWPSQPQSWPTRLRSIAANTRTLPSDTLFDFLIKYSGGSLICSLLMLSFILLVLQMFQRLFSIFKVSHENNVFVKCCYLLFLSVSIASTKAFTYSDTYWKALKTTSISTFPITITMQLHQKKIFLNLNY